MIKITKKIEKKLTQNNPSKIGLFCELGYFGEESTEFVIYYDDENNGPFLAHISEFERKDLIFIRLKEK